MIILYSWNTVREFSSSTGLTVLAYIQLAPEPFIVTDSNDICLQAEARRTKVKEARKRREERQVLKKEEMLKVNNVVSILFLTLPNFSVHCWRCSSQGGPGQEVDHCRLCHCKVCLLNKDLQLPTWFCYIHHSTKLSQCGGVCTMDVSSYCTFSMSYS